MRPYQKSINMYSNFIHSTISQEQILEITAAIDRINAQLPTLVSLTNEELSSLPKVSMKNIDFIHEVLDFADTYPDLVPSHIDVQEIRKDLGLIESISKILKPMKQLVKKLEDSALLAGSEAYIPSLAIYNSVKAGTARSRSHHMTIR
jgi:hypothetical protein